MNNDFNNKIKGCYGNADMIFAGHALESKHAAKVLSEANELEIGFKEYVDYHKSFLKQANVSDEHMEKQLKKVQDIRSYFMHD